MKRIILILNFIFVFCISVLPQTITQSELLGHWIGGEDPSEFLYHSVMEQSRSYLADNPEGALIIRICSLDNFSTAFVKAPLNPLAASNYNIFSKRIIVPNEKIFIANSSKCFDEKKFVFNQYWFVPNENNLDYKERFPVNTISYKVFDVADYEITNDKYEKRSRKKQKNKFVENITEFITELKNNPKTEGFIVYNSKNKIIKNNIEKVKTALKKESINPERVKTVIKTRVDGDGHGKLKLVKDEKQFFPRLEILTIK